MRVTWRTAGGGVKLGEGGATTGFSICVVIRGFSDGTGLYEGKYDQVSALAGVATCAVAKSAAASRKLKRPNRMLCP
jgi:hypothetical protein